MMTRQVVFLALLQVVAGQYGYKQAPSRQDEVQVAPLAPAPAAPAAPVADQLSFMTAPAPQVPSGCINYMAGVGCDWTLKWNCPFQVPLGSSGQADIDRSHGFHCCCDHELWKYATSNNPSVPDAVGPPPPVGTPLNPTPPPPPVGRPLNPTPTVHWKQGFTMEGIPNYIYHHKYPLMQWFEDNSQCPLKPQDGGFPAWMGYKSVMASGGAITTPNYGLAGNRTLQVSGFGPTIQSTGYECVAEGNELKARVVGFSNISIALDGLFCQLRDITLFKTSPTNEMGIRLDFATCSGDIDLGLLSRHVPRTAAIRMDVRAKQPEDVESNLGKFFMGVCGGGSPASILTAQLPKFIYPRKPGLEARAQPVCFAHSANALHVMGKSCFEDFLFMDWLAPPPVDPVTGFPVFSSDPELASIPTEDHEMLKNMIPAFQPQYHPKIAEQIKMHGAPAPTSAPTSAQRLRACGPLYVCQPGTHRIPGSSGKNCGGAFCQPNECCQPNRRLAAPSQALFKSKKLFWGLGAAKTAATAADGSPCDPQQSGRRLVTGVDPCAPQTDAPTTPAPTTPPPGATCACSKGGVSGTPCTTFATGFCTPFQCPSGSTLDPRAATIFCGKPSGCDKADTNRCCIMTTTPPPTISEVPGVILADRICIRLSGSGSCDNDCDCVRRPPNSVPSTTSAPGPTDQYWCLDFWAEIMLIGIIAFIPMVWCSTRALKSWAINPNYGHAGGNCADEDGYGYATSPWKTANEVCSCGNVFVRDAIYCRKCSKKRPLEVHNISALHSAMNSLTQYTGLNENASFDGASRGDANPTFVEGLAPLRSYKDSNKLNGTARLRYIESSYLRHDRTLTLLINFFVIMCIGVCCISSAYWCAWGIMTYFNCADYVFPVCLPLLPICPVGTWDAQGVFQCGATPTTWLYNPDCVCYTSLYSLGLALGCTIWWGHWLFWISKRVHTETNESTSTAARVYAYNEYEEVRNPTGLVSQRQAFNGGFNGPVRWAQSFLYPTS